MDKPKLKAGLSSTKKSQQIPGDLIALGSKSTTVSTSVASSSKSSQLPSKSSSSSTKSSRDSGGSSSGAPPPKKLRISPPRTSSTSGSSSSHHHASSKGTGGTGKVKKDPLDLGSSSSSSASSSSSSSVISTSDLVSDKFFNLIEKSSKSSPETAQSVLLTALKRLRSPNAKDKEQIQICENILLVVKTYPSLFKTIPILDSLVTLVHPKEKKEPATTALGLKAKLLLSTNQQNPFAVFALQVIYLLYCGESHWPIPLIQLWVEDASGDRNWVDNPALKGITDNLLQSFGTIPPSSTLLPAGDGMGGTGSGGGSSPNPLGGDEAGGNGNISVELERLLQEEAVDDGNVLALSVRNRYSGLETNLEEIILEYAGEVVHKKSPDIPKNLLKALSFACGLSGVRAWIVTRVEQWLHNGKLGRVAQELLLYLSVNANCNTSADVEVITNLCKLKMKTKPLTHFYCIALREMVRDNDANLRHVLNLTVYNELSPQRNPNNFPILGAIAAGVPESRTVLADIFMDLLTKRDDFHTALRLILREIVRAARFECDLSRLVEGLMKQRELTCTAEIKERTFVTITDLYLLSMFLSISPQVREAAAVAAVRGEPKDITTLTNYRASLSMMQSHAVAWMYSVVPKMFRPAKKTFLECLNKVVLKDPLMDLMTKDGWPPESEKNLFAKLCLEVGFQESSLVFILMMGVSKDHPLSANEALDIIEHMICRAAIYKTGLQLQKIEIIELLFRLSEYRHPDNIALPIGYEPPKMAVSNFYWRSWALLCIVTAFNPSVFGKTAWSDYPTLKVFMEMCMTNSFIFPTASSLESESSDEIVSRELQTTAMEKEEILEFETHLAAASSKATITESSSLLLKQLMRLEPFGPVRTPPGWILTQLQTYNDQMGLGHHLCGSRNPDFLLDLIQRNSEPMPWLARLVSEGSFDILPDQCLCEFLMGHMPALERALTLSRNEDSVPGRSPRKGVKGQIASVVDLGLNKEDAKLLQLLQYLQEKVYGSSENGESRKVLEYFFKRLSAPKMLQRSQALNALKLLLVRDEEASGTNPEDWLLDVLPSLSVFPEIQETALVLLRQAILIENDPNMLCRYLDFLSTWVQVSEDLEGLALDVANLVVERNGLMCIMMSKFSMCYQSLFDIFFTYMKKIRGPHKESYKWSDSQDQVLVTWPVERLEGTMNILIVHAIVILISSYSAYSQSQEASKKAATGKNKDLNTRFCDLLEMWFPSKKDNSPKGYLLNTSEEAVLFPDWVKLKMIRSNNPRLLEVATQGLEIEQLLLFVQHFGIPVQSMTALLYIMDTVSEKDPEKLIRSVNMNMNASFLYKLVRAHWKRGAAGGEKFVNVLQTKCGVSDTMDVDSEQGAPQPSRMPLVIGSRKEHKKSHPPSTPAMTRMHTGGGTPTTSMPVPAFSPSSFSNKRKSIEVLSKELLNLASPPSSRRRSSVPVSKGEDVSFATLRRHSAHVDEAKTLVKDDSLCDLEVGSEAKSPSKYLGKLVDQITQVEPCIVRNALEYQLPLLFGKSESNSSCRSFLMTALAHQAGWETIQRCLTLFLKEFDPSYDPSSILDLIQATHSNPKLFQGVDKYVPKHQPNLSVMHLTTEQLAVMADYIVEEISQIEMKSTKFSITNLLGPAPAAAASSAKKPKQGLQGRVKLWLQCAQQEKSKVDKVIASLMEKKWRNPCVKRFVRQVYVEFPEVILVDNWRWKTDEMNVSEEEVTSLLDTISHGLITALANTQPGKDWAKKQAREYEVCLRKLASLHPTLLLRQLNLMGALLEGRVHLESSAFHQQNHNLPFIVFLALFDMMQPHILKHFKQLKATFLLYFKLFKNYGTTKDYSSSLSRFSILLHNFLTSNPTEVKDYMAAHYVTLRELSTLKYYAEIAPLHNLLGCLDPISSSSTASATSTSSSGSSTAPVTTAGDYLAPIVTTLHDRLLHASNNEETVPVLQELDSVSNRNPSVLNNFSENLNLLMKSESENCRSLAFSLVLKHCTYYPAKSVAYLETVLQLLEDDNAHLRDTMIDRIHEFVVLAQERSEDILIRMFQLGISSNVNFLGPIQKSLAMLRNYSSLGCA